MRFAELSAPESSFGRGLPSMVCWLFAVPLEEEEEEEEDSASRA